jgi:hypothetical protein
MKKETPLWWMQNRGRWRTSTVNEDNTTKTVMVSRNHLNCEKFNIKKLIVKIDISWHIKRSCLHCIKGSNKKNTFNAISQLKPRICCLLNYQWCSWLHHFRKHFLLNCYWGFMKNDVNISNSVTINKQDLDGLFSFNCVPRRPSCYTEKVKESIQILQCRHQANTDAPKQNKLKH